MAVVGASSVPFKWGFETLQKLIQSGYKGAIYPVNPGVDKIQGLPAYRTVGSIPNDIDLAVIALRAESVPQAMRECVQKGIKAAVIISAGFAETGEHGRALQEEISEIARDGGMRFVGPNCMGIWNTASNLNLAVSSDSRRGSIGFISQSGTFGGLFARAASAKGSGLSKFVSAGNQADLDIADYLEYLADDPYTKAIVMYVEGIRDGRKLFEVAKKMAGKKPVVVYKAGRNQAIARVAMSHTASIAGEDRVFDAMCQQVGFIRANELLGSLDMAIVLTRQPLPKSNRVGILSTGGQSVVLADTCVSAGMEIPELKSEDISFIISDVDFPPHAPPPRNPVDFAGANRTPVMEAKVLNKLAQLDYIDIIVCNTPVHYQHAAETSTAELEKLDSEAGRLLAEIPQKYGKPIVTIGFDNQSHTARPIKRALDNAGIPCYSTAEEAVRAIHTLVKYATIKRQMNK